MVNGSSSCVKRQTTRYCEFRDGVYFTLVPLNRCRQIGVYMSWVYSVPVMAILADHLEVPSSTDCLTVFILVDWLRRSAPNTLLYSQNALLENCAFPWAFVHRGKWGQATPWIKNKKTENMQKNSSFLCLCYTFYPHPGRGKAFPWATPWIKK